MSDERKLRDHSVPASGGEKTQRVLLGLELLMLAARPGVALSQEDIAAWCGCTRGAVYVMEKEALKKLRNRLQFGRAVVIGKEIR